MFGLNDNNQDDNSDKKEAASAAVYDTGPGASAAPAPAPEPLSQAEPAGPPDVNPAAKGNSDLIEIKEQALHSLSPLVSHLDQSPEERFRTLMMMIQASDNSRLIKDAYEAANRIEDEKARAQALLDVINEINYFTQKDGDLKDD